MRKLFIILSILFSIINIASAQPNFGSISGNISIEAQTYKEDSLIQALDTPEKMLSNSSLHLYFRLNQFEISTRFEAFLNPILGIDPRYQGAGIAYRNITYRGDKIEATAGNFYDQFGSGLIFRSYYEPALGIDNSVEGVRVIVKPTPGLEVKGIIGHMREFWDYSSSIIRAGNIDFSSSEIFPDLMPKSWNLTLGASLVSKFEEDKNTDLILPLNQLSYSGRFGLFANNLSFEGEFGISRNHPEALNKFTYNDGTAVTFTITYLGNGIGTSLSFHRIDNMDLRAETSARGIVLTQNYIPSLTKQHLFSKYSLIPFGTQFNGEIGFQWDANYHFDESTFIGGENGADLNMNASWVNSIRKNAIDEFTYDSPFFELGDTLFFVDINAEYTKYINENFDYIVRFAHIINNKDFLYFSGAPHFGKVTADFIGFESTYRFSNDYALHSKVEHLWQSTDSLITEEDNENGNWISGLAELAIKSKLMLAASIDYNYGNNYEERKLVYYNFNLAYLFDATRISLSYGKTSAGILCVGGVCRTVPATNGFYLSLTSSF